MRRIAAGLLAGAAALGAAVPARAARLTIPARARQLVVVSSPTADPPGVQSVATLRAFVRGPGRSRWRLRYGPWPAETGSGHFVAAAHRREGDRATPIGIFSFGHTIYGIKRNPGGLHYRYRRLVCGDWWDEDPYSARYNRFTHLRCGMTPDFGGASEALWTDRLAYPYFAVIDFNIGPIHGGAAATGSGIFLHSWIYAPTQGCVALPARRLLKVLRWLRPSQDPAIEMGPDRDLSRATADAMPRHLSRG